MEAIPYALLSLLQEERPLGRLCSLTPLNGGMSGAVLHRVEMEQGGEKKTFVLKWAARGTVPPEVFGSFRREAAFYRLAGEQGRAFLPEIAYQAETDEGLLLAMKAYAPLTPSDWNPDTLEKAAVLLAEIHALSPSLAERAGWEPGIGEPSEEGIACAAEDWRSVLTEHGGRFDPSLIVMVARAIPAVSRFLCRPPLCLCHGDFHWGNLLKDGDILRVCDWQGVSVGKGGGDISFFFSRAAADGKAADQTAFLTRYTTELTRRTGRTGRVEELLKEQAAAVLQVNFLCWAGYLHGAEASRVETVYREMEQAYRQWVKRPGLVV